MLFNLGLWMNELQCNSYLKGTDAGHTKTQKRLLNNQFAGC